MRAKPAPTTPWLRSHQRCLEVKRGARLDLHRICMGLPQIFTGASQPRIYAENCQNAALSRDTVRGEGTHRTTAQFRSVTMPTIPYRARPYAGPSDTIHDPESPHRRYSLQVRIRTATHRRELTRRLADGVDPETQVELSLCAAQLTSPRRRKSLARSLKRTV